MKIKVFLKNKFIQRVGFSSSLLLIISNSQRVSKLIFFFSTLYALAKACGDDCIANQGKWMVKNTHLVQVKILSVFIVVC